MPYVLSYCSSSIIVVLQWKTIAISCTHTLSPSGDWYCNYTRNSAHVLSLLNFYYHLQRKYNWRLHVWRNCAFFSGETGPLWTICLRPPLKFTRCQDSCILFLVGYTTGAHSSLIASSSILQFISKTVLCLHNGKCIIFRPEMHQHAFPGVLLSY